MDAIVFANINARSEQAIAEDEAVVESMREFLRRQHLSATVRYVRTINELAAELTSSNPVALITNFPPNSTYDSAHLPVLQRGPGGMVYASEADSYSTTKGALKGILCNQQNLRTLVVTGAPRNQLTDEEIIDTAGRWAIRVARKGELFTHPHGYERAYGSLIFQHVAQALRPHDDAEADWRRVQVEWSREQLGATRVLVLARKQIVATSVCQGLSSVFTETATPLVFRVAASIDEAHELLLQGQIEIVLSAFDAGYWCPIHEAILQQKLLVQSICLLRATDMLPNLPNGLIAITSDSQGRIDAEEVARRILDGLRRMRSRISAPAGLMSLQREMLKELQTCDRYALARALRVLTGHHRSVLNALSAEASPLNLFIPIASAAELEAVMRKALFVGDRAVFTQLPAKQSIGRIDGGNVEVIPLWEFDGASCGSMIQANVADVIRRYGRLFADGRALFYPSPTLIGVTSRNVDELMPEAKSALSARPDLPIWRECRAFEQYISADKISSSHVVIDEYRQIANIGKAVASIEIPYICNVSPELFDQLLQDNQESLSKFRARTKRVIDDLVDSQSDLDSERIRKRFRRDVDDGVKELDSKLQVLRQSTALQQAGGLILTTVSTLAAISVVDIPAAAAKLLGSGGLGSMAFQYASYLLQLKALRRSPYHIVWQFRRNDPAKV